MTSLFSAPPPLLANFNSNSSKPLDIKMTSTFGQNLRKPSQPSALNPHFSKSSHYVDQTSPTQGNPMFQPD